MRRTRDAYEPVLEHIHEYQAMYQRYLEVLFEMIMQEHHVSTPTAAAYEAAKAKGQTPAQAGLPELRVNQEFSYQVPLANRISQYLQYMPQKLEGETQSHSFYLMVSINARPADTHAEKSTKPVQIERWLFCVTQNTREQLAQNLKKGQAGGLGGHTDNEISNFELQQFSEEMQAVKSKLVEGCRVVKSLLMTLPGWKMVNQDKQGRFQFLRKRDRQDKFQLGYHFEVSSSAEKLEEKHSFQCEYKTQQLSSVRSSFGDFSAQVSYVENHDTIAQCFEQTAKEERPLAQPAGLLMVSNYLGGGAQRSRADSHRSAQSKNTDSARGQAEKNEEASGLKTSSQMQHLQSPQAHKEKQDSVTSSNKAKRNLSNLVPQENYIGGGRRPRANTENFLILPGIQQNQDDGDSSQNDQVERTSGDHKRVESNGSFKHSIQRMGSAAISGLIGGLGLRKTSQGGAKELMESSEEQTDFSRVRHRNSAEAPSQRTIAESFYHVERLDLQKSSELEIKKGTHHRRMTLDEKAILGGINIIKESRITAPAEAQRRFRLKMRGEHGHWVDFEPGDSSPTLDSHLLQEDPMDRVKAIFGGDSSDFELQHTRTHLSSYRPSPVDAEQAMDSNVSSVIERLPLSPDILAEERAQSALDAMLAYQDKWMIRQERVISKAEQGLVLGKKQSSFAAQHIQEKSEALVNTGSKDDSDDDFEIEGSGMTDDSKNSMDLNANLELMRAESELVEQSTKVRGEMQAIDDEDELDDILAVLRSMKSVLASRRNSDDSDNLSDEELTNAQRTEYFEMMRLRTVLKAQAPFLVHVNKEIEGAAAQVARDVHLRLSQRQQNS